MTERIPLRGRSMRPLGAGWFALVLPEPLSRGDLVCYLGPTGLLQLHRVHGVTDEWLFVRGDTAAPEPAVPRASVVGRVCALERGGIRIPLEAGSVTARALASLGLAWASAVPRIVRLRRALGVAARKV